MDIRRLFDGFSREDLENGKRIFESGGVTGITRGLSGRFYGTVRDRFVEYRTNLTLSPELTVERTECSCSSEGFCPHRAAFLTAILPSLDKNPSAASGKCIFSDHGFAAVCGEYIATASRGPETPAVARRITDMGRVELISDKTEQGLRTVLARVGGHNRFSSATETVRLVLGRDGLPTEGSCGCMPAGGAFLCEHMAALLFTLFPGESAPEVVTSDAIHRLIAEARPVRPEPVAEGGLRLVPELTFTFDSRLVLSFLIGRDRLFAVRSISEFLEAVRNGTPLAYGKNCVFDHSIEAFDSKSRGYIRFLRSRAPWDMPFYGRRASSVLLDENCIDDFFDIHGCEPLLLNSAKTELTAEDPEFRVLFSPAGRSGCRMTFDGELPAVLGIGERCYVLSGGRLHLCSRGFTKSVSRLLSDVSAAGKDGLLMSGGDMGRFFSRVIRPARDHVSWRFSDPALREKLPGELSCRIVISALGPDSARAEAEFSYGEKKYPLFQRTKDADTRDIALEARIERTLLKYFPTPLPQESAAEIRRDSGAVFMLSLEGLDALRALAQVETGSAPLPRVRASGDIRFSLDLSGGLLELSLTGGEYTAAELSAVLEALDRGERFARFEDGSFADLSDGTLERVSELFRGLTLSPGELTENMKLPLFRMFYLEAAAAEKSLSIDRTARFRRASAPPPDSSPEELGVPRELAKLLRPYQEEGFLWMRSLESRGFGGILADDMGLGKTVQALALVHSTPPAGGENRPVLVVCPTSLVANWAAETRNFAPELEAVTVSGTAAERREGIGRLKTAALGITSYDALKRDLPLYRDVCFRAVIADEAQYIKNRTTQAANAVKALSSRVKFALTGTPVENSPAELWSIFDYLMPGYLGSYAEFRRRAELPIASGDGAALGRLRSQTSPFVLRRVKRDVLSELPEKTESVLYTRLTGEQKKAYTAVNAAMVAELREKLLGGETAASLHFDVLTMLLRLRQICCHPPLCLGEEYSGESAKLELCMDLLESLRAGGHRVLIFSQFTSMLDVIAGRLGHSGESFFTLTGKTPAAQRLELVERFNGGECGVFLISLKAGGTGLNLTGADTVIHYDPWWNLAAQDQATDRAHRIGQENKVHVWRLIAEETVEQKILELQEKKAGLASALIDGSSGSASVLSPEELLSLLEV